MNQDNQPELLEDLIQSVKQDVVDLNLSKTQQDDFKILKSLNSIPKANVPVANFERIKNQVLDRIAIPKETSVTPSGLAGFFMNLPRVLRISGGIIGSFLILVSLSIGTAAVALESVPGQPMYPIKKVVENVQLKMADSESEKVNLRIKFANNRLEELEKVLERNRQGKVSGADVQRIVADTLKDVADTTASISQSSATSDDSAAVANKLAELNEKQNALLEIAAISSEGEVKIDIEKALESTKITQEQALANIGNAGIRVEDEPIILEDDSEPNDLVEIHGKLSAVTEIMVEIGSAEILLTETTEYVNVDPAGLKIDQVVNIEAEVIDGKTYALRIVLETDVETSEETSDSEEGANEQNVDSQTTTTETVTTD